MANLNVSGSSASRIPQDQPASTPSKGAKSIQERIAQFSPTKQSKEPATTAKPLSGTAKKIEAPATKQPQAAATTATKQTQSSSVQATTDSEILDNTRQHIEKITRNCAMLFEKKTHHFNHNDLSLLGTMIMNLQDNLSSLQKMEKLIQTARGNTPAGKLEKKLKSKLNAYEDPEERTMIFRGGEMFNAYTKEKVDEASILKERKYNNAVTEIIENIINLLHTDNPILEQFYTRIEQSVNLLEGNEKLIALQKLQEDLELAVNQRP